MMQKNFESVEIINPKHQFSLIIDSCLFFTIFTSTQGL